MTYAPMKIKRNTTMVRFVHLKVLSIICSVFMVTILLKKRGTKDVMLTNHQVCNKEAFRSYMNNGMLSNEITNILARSCRKTKPTQRCRQQLYGRISADVSLSKNDSKSMQNESYRLVQLGGWFTPKSCEIKRHVAIIVPFRNRENHLTIFLRHMHPILQRQNLHYRIFVVNQVDKSNFNRGKLLNVGFIESQKFFPYDCVVFHDVDLLSEDDRNTFDCSTSPQHMCAALDKFNYRLLYEELFGGVEMFTMEHFRKINGFSNSFWSWGAEDDNLYKRVVSYGLTLWRPPMEYSRYQMILHKDEEATADSARYKTRDESVKHFATDGLINLQYDVLSIREEKFHTHIKVDLRKDRDKMFGVMKFPT